MTDRPNNKVIVTEGDAKVNTIDALGDISHVASRLCSSIEHLRMFVSDKVSNPTQKKTILKQINLISRGTKYLADRAEYITSQSSLKSITKRTESRKRAAFNLQNKKDSILRPSRRQKSYINEEDKILAKVVDQKTLKTVTPEKRNPGRKAKLNPCDGKTFTLKEAFMYMESEDVSANKFFNMCTNIQDNPVHPKLLCSLSTFQRRYKTFKTTKVYPNDTDEGIQVGARQAVKDKDIPLLNKGLENTVGVVEDNYDLSTAIVTINEKEKETSGDYIYHKSPCASTIQFYQMLAVNQCEKIHLVKDANVKIKDKRRQMASTSIRNLSSHIAAVAYANFIPVAEKWNPPKGLTLGSHKMLQLLKQITGSHFKPIHPAYLLNEDCSSQYYFCGSVKKDHGNNGWSRVQENSLKCRDKDSLWSPDDSKNTICKGIRVKFACGGSAFGFVYPICLLISNLSKEEFPSNDFVVIPIKGMTINGHIDPRCEEEGYLCLMGSNVPQKRFFDWYYKTVTCEMVATIRKKFNPLSATSNIEEDIPIDQRFVMWGDSDIPYLQEMTSPKRIESNAKKGIYFAKIGAKITETSQPLDLGPFFKILKVSGKHMTSVEIEKPLSIVIDILFKKLRKDKILNMSSLKEHALKDLLVTCPEMMAASFKQSSLVKSFVDAGMLDTKHKRCPDVYGIMNSFKIDWSTVPGGKQWFMKMLPNVIAEMFSEGGIAEQFYDDHDYPLDRDHNGAIWRLRSDADHLTRSKVLYHPSVLAKKSEDIRLCLEAQTSKEIKVYEDAKAMFEMNIDFETKLKVLMAAIIHEDVNSDFAYLHLISLEMFEKAKVQELTAFYRCRVQEDLKLKMIMPNKGNVAKVRGGEIDRKTNGPLLIQLCFDVKSLPVIAKDPVIPVAHVVVQDIEPPTILKFQSDLTSMNIDNVNAEWMNLAKEYFDGINSQLSLECIQKVNTEWDNVHSYVDLLSTKLISRLYCYLKTRLPLSRSDLMPGRHWVWESFKAKIKKICGVMILSGHIISSNRLEFRFEDESLLNYVSAFRTIDITLSDDDIDGNYVVVDSNRSMIIRSGAAEVGIIRRMKEHTAASMLKEHSQRTNKFYASYPNSECANKDLLHGRCVKGTFQDLSWKVGIGMKKDKLKEVVELFEWNVLEVKELTVLNGNGNRQGLNEKKYRHLCYLFELAYALAMEPRKNISSNPGCEWQLQYYGK